MAWSKKMKKNHNIYNEYEMEESPEILGYCPHCKDPVFSTEEYLKKNSKIFYHKECWENMNGFKEELFFD